MPNISLTVSYQQVVDEHFPEGAIITAKPTGMVWTEAELGPGMALVTLDIDYALAVQVSQNMADYRVDDVNNPITAVRV